MRQAAEKVLKAWESGRGLPDALGELRHALEAPQESHAMRLAEVLDKSVLQVNADAAAELRRLHDLNAERVAAYGELSKERDAMHQHCLQLQSENRQLRWERQQLREENSNQGLTILRLKGERAALAQDEPTVVTDDMAYRFRRAYTDAPASAYDIEDIKRGLAAVFAAAPHRRKPLTDQQIDAIADGIPVDDIDGSPLAASRWHIRLARAVEKHHGIGGDK